jgi:hypothetical protein
MLHMKNNVLGFDFSYFYLCHTSRADNLWRGQYYEINVYIRVASRVLGVAGTAVVADTGWRCMTESVNVNKGRSSQDSDRSIAIAKYYRWQISNQINGESAFMLRFRDIAHWNV